MKELRIHVYQIEWQTTRKNMTKEEIRETLSTLPKNCDLFVKPTRTAFGGERVQKELEESYGWSAETFQYVVKEETHRKNSSYIW